MKLRDVRLPEDAPEFSKARDWLHALAGRRVKVAAAQAGADRWDRLAADIYVIDGSSPLDVSELLVAAGWAIVDPGARTVLCRPDLLMAEQRARAGRAGLWASTRHGPVWAGDAERLRAAVGRYALIEGVVRSVGERRERTYLNFGQDWTQDLTITIPKRTWAMMQERGLRGAQLRGKRIRARGIVEEWQGVTIEITVPEMLEVLPQERTRP